MVDWGRTRLRRFVRFFAMLAATVVVLVAGLFVVARAVSLFSSRFLEADSVSQSLYLGLADLAISALLVFVAYRTFRIDAFQRQARFRIENFRVILDASQGQHHLRFEFELLNRGGLDSAIWESKSHARIGKFNGDQPRVELDFVREVSGVGPNVNTIDSGYAADLVIASGDVARILAYPREPVDVSDVEGKFVAVEIYPVVGRKAVEAVLLGDAQVTRSAARLLAKLRRRLKRMNA